MYKVHIMFLVCYIIALIAAYFMKIYIYKIATKAIINKKLSTGIFALFPVEGEKAVELAKGYINAAKIVFWFVVIFFPFLFVISIIQGSI